MEPKPIWVTGKQELQQKKKVQERMLLKYFRLANVTRKRANYNMDHPFTRFKDTPIDY